ncbi:MAG: hypothetical protein EB053_07020 [Chlamydiae bacterium]|nr:hypothetical protein [Chlamydiota bacterium]
MQEEDLNSSYKKLAPVIEDEHSFIFSVGLARKNHTEKKGRDFPSPPKYPPLPKKKEIKEFL